MNRPVQYGRDLGSNSRVLLNSLVQNVICQDMGRPRKFSRDGVLQRALPVFWKYGFSRTTLPDLESATGVNKSGLYSEFESKEELFLACLRYYRDTHIAGVLLSAEPSGWCNIQKFLEQAPGRARDQRGCFSVNSMRELTGLPPEARKTISDALGQLKRLLRINIAAENPKMDVDVLCDLVLVFFSGICIEANLNVDRSRTRLKIENFIQMLRAA
jgi:TetR/AcrR family transcriptional regulator, copper-responsive repressor